METQKLGGRLAHQPIVAFDQELMSTPSNIVEDDVEGIFNLPHHCGWWRVDLGESLEDG